MSERALMKTRVRASERSELVTTSVRVRVRVQTRNIYEPLLTPSHLLRSAQCVEYLLSLSKKAGTLATWINQYSDSGGTPVMFAAGGGNKEIIQLLIDNGADVSLQVKAEPAYLDKMAKMIAEGHSPEEHTDGITALHVAATGGKFEGESHSVSACLEEEDNYIYEPLLS